jgi:hypothetical protein
MPCARSKHNGATSGRVNRSDQNAVLLQRREKKREWRRVPNQRRAQATEKVMLLPVYFLSNHLDFSVFFRGRSSAIWRRSTIGGITIREAVTEREKMTSMSGFVFDFPKANLAMPFMFDRSSQLSRDWVTKSTFALVELEIRHHLRRSFQFLHKALIQGKFAFL